MTIEEYTLQVEKDLRKMRMPSNYIKIVQAMVQTAYDLGGFNAMIEVDERINNHARN